MLIRKCWVKRTCQNIRSFIMLGSYSVWSVCGHQSQLSLRHGPRRYFHNGCCDGDKALAASQVKRKSKPSVAGQKRGNGPFPCMLFFINSSLFKICDKSRRFMTNRKQTVSGRHLNNRITLHKSDAHLSDWWTLRTPARDSAASLSIRTRVVRVSSRFWRRSISPWVLCQFRPRDTN